MPIYDHVCDHCGHAFSVVRSYSDPPVERCPTCGKRPRRLITPSAIVFKGSGWYKTDSRASSAPAEKEGSKAASGSSTSESATSTDKRSAEKKSAEKPSAPAKEATS